MNESTTVAEVPMYVELAPAASTPGAGTAGALLRDYLAILAFHFERQRSNRNAAAIGAALANLSGLLLQSTLQTNKEVTVTLTSAVDGLAGILANEWGAVADSPDLLSLSRPMIARLRGGDGSAPAGNSFEVTLIVLQRPVNAAPTLGSVTLSLSLRQDDATVVEPARTLAPTATSTRSLSVGCSRTTYTVVDSQLASSQTFVADLSRKGLIADLGTTPGYVAISL